jgi:hypothetical protein
MGPVMEPAMTKTTSIPGLIFRLAISLALVPLSAGCAASAPAALEPRGTELAPRAPREADQVEVWLDARPAGPFAVVGELQARGKDTTVSIRKMQERAAAAGFDGIYWIDCESACQGNCTAQAFIYSEPHPRRGRPMGGRQVAAR